MNRNVTTKKLGTLELGPFKIREVFTTHFKNPQFCFLADGNFALTIKAMKIGPVSVMISH